MPFGPYVDFNDCVSKNGDKTSPEAFCAWLEYKITGHYPGEMNAEAYPAEFWTAYDEALSKQLSAKEAYDAGVAAAEAAGYKLSRFGFVRELQAPAMKTVANVRVFGAGTWTDSAGFTKTWTEDDLDAMVAARESGVPEVAPVKCGHTSDEFNQKIAEALGVPIEVVTGEEGQGQIAIGYISSLARKGDWIIASFEAVPEPIANLIEAGLYGTVSVEIEDQVDDFGPCITGVALLGAEAPAVSGATLEKALVFGGTRTGARVWSFKTGEDIPMSELKAEFDEIRGKLAEIVKGKRGAPIFRALFGNLSELFDRLTRNHSAAGEEPGDNQKAPLEESNNEEGGTYQMDGIKELLGLPPETTDEEVIAAIKALMEKAQGEPAMKEGDLTGELQKANDKIADLQKRLDGQTSLSAWKSKVSAFTAIPGTADEIAAKLADIEAKAGPEAAEAQFAALEEANRLSAEAQKIIGTARKGEPSSFDNEVVKYRKDNPTATKAQAIEAVSKAHPDLWFARRDNWDQ